MDISISLVVKYPDGFTLTYNKIPYQWLRRRLPRRNDKCLRPSAISVHYQGRCVPNDLLLELYQAWKCLHPLKREYVKLNGKYLMKEQAS